MAIMLHVICSFSSLLWETEMTTAISALLNGKLLCRQVADDVVPLVPLRGKLVVHPYSWLYSRSHPDALGTGEKLY